MSDVGIKERRSKVHQRRKLKRPVVRRSGEAGRTATPITTGLTAEVFESQYADVPLCELERGEVVYLTSGGPKHSLISLNIGGILRQCAKRSKTGRVLANEAGLFTERDPDTVRGVDRVWIVNPKARTLRVFTADEDPVKYDASSTIRDDAILPGFSRKVSEFFED